MGRFEDPFVSIITTVQLILGLAVALLGLVVAYYTILGLLMVIRDNPVVPGIIASMIGAAAVIYLLNFLLE